jgi:hypothetical protein
MRKLLCAVTRPLPTPFTKHRTHAKHFYQCIDNFEVPSHAFVHRHRALLHVAQASDTPQATGSSGPDEVEPHWAHGGTCRHLPGSPVADALSKTINYRTHCETIT